MILLVIGIILLAYFTIVLILNRIGIFEKYNISFWGPAILLRTSKGKKLIDKIASKKRFWIIFSNVGIFVCFILMFLMLYLLALTVPFAFQAEDNIVSSNPTIMIGLPGLNPIIPLGYGIIAFIVALIVHEFSHGILSRAQGLKIKSLGLLYFIIPLGAFCEPDEEELKNTSNKKRMRIFAAGPMANVVTAFICLGLISLMVVFCVQPADDGIGITSVGDDMPADQAGIEPGMIITSINNTKVNNLTIFENVMAKTKANQTVEISFVNGEREYTKNVKLSDKYSIAQNLLIERHGYVNDSMLLSISEYKDKGYLGVVGNTQYKSDLIFMKNPFTAFPAGFMYYIGLPIFSLFDGYSSFNEPFSNFFIVDSFIPDSTFWMLINTFYWVFWFNFMVATFNVLPMIPLDGGYMFIDTIDSFIKKIKSNMKKETREKITRRITTIISLILLFIILAPIILPNIRNLFF